MKLFKSRFLRNASWIIAGRIMQSLLSLIVSILTARYLGPSNYGLINYAAAFVTFFTAFCTLGINGILVKELLSNKDKQGEIIGSSIVLRLISSAMSIGTISLLVYILNPKEPLTILVVFLYSLNLIFQAFDTIQYWYQSNLMSKVHTCISLIGYVVMSAYKIFLLATQKSIQWFAVSNALDTFVIALLLVIFYRKNHGQKLAVSFKQSIYILKNSYHFILSGLAVAVYNQIASIMLKHFVDEAAVGYFTTAINISNIWAFVLAAIIDSARPLIMEERNRNYELYKRRIRLLYSVIIYMSFFVAGILTIIAKFAVTIMYGDAYLSAITPVRIVSWYTGFSYLGVARSIWLVSENKQKYEKLIAVVGALFNIILNVILIPPFGIIGASLTALATQIVTNFILGFMVKPIRENSIMILKAFNPINLLELIKKPKEKKNEGNDD